MAINNLTIGDIIAKTIPFLNEKGIPNPRLEADLMLAHILNLPRVKLYAQWDRQLNSSEVQLYREIILKRVQGCPLAYLTGKKCFLSWDFLVTPAVLIPRPETELLIEAAVDLLKDRAEIRGVDVGTGSGVIAVALAKLLPNSSWHAIDISNEALDIAKENARQLGVDSQITFIAGDLLGPLLASSPIPQFDLVVSNPPYIPSDEIQTLQAEVRQEPLLALDGGKDGLTIYRKLIPQAFKILAENGFLIVEHGFQQRPDLEVLMTAMGFSGKSLTDLSGWERILVSQKESHA